MLEVVGVSLGSPKRDFQVEVCWAGQALRLRRRGSGGDLGRARGWMAELDGRVAAIGMGGINHYLGWPGRRFRFRQGRELAEAARLTPVADGWGFKQHWEPLVISKLAERGLLGKGESVLVASALDRWSQAEALDALGYSLILADPLSALGIPLVFSKLWQLQAAACLALPLFCLLPISLLYPANGEEGAGKPRNWRPEVKVWAGDTRFLRLYRPVVPPRLVFASTLDAGDVSWFRSLGAEWLAAPAPLLGNGRCPGANLMEAAVSALTGLTPGELKAAHYLEFWSGGYFAPYLEKLN